MSGGERRPGRRGWRARTARVAGVRGPGVADDLLRRRVAGRVVLVTGASEGIGEAAARRLGAAGATVLLVARTAGRLEAVRDGIRAAGGVAHAYPVDLSRPEAAAALADEVLAVHGRVDVVVSNAGRSIRRSVADTADRFHDVRRLTDVNHLGPVQLLLRLLPAMRAAGGGHVVNVSSAPLGLPAPHWSAYLASKSAFDTWLRCVGPEVRADGVTVATVHLGLVRTRMSAPTAHYRRMPAMTSDEAADVVCRAIARRRSWRPWWARVGVVAAAAAPGPASSAAAVSVRATAAGSAALALARTGAATPRRLGRLARAALRSGPTAAALVAASPPDAVALLTDDGPLTYGRLAAAAASHPGVEAAGVGPGDRAALACADPAALVCAVLAVTGRGADAVLLPPDLPAGRRAAVLAAQRATVLVTGPDDGRRLAPPAVAHRAGRWRRPAAVVVLTSGTTGIPRGVPQRLPWRTLLAAVTTHLRLVPLRPGAPVVVAPPLHHGYGLAYLVGCLALGLPAVPAAGLPPERLLDAAAGHRAQLLVALPIQLRRAVDLPPAVLDRFRAATAGTLRAVVSGGAPLPPALHARAVEVFGDRVHDLYGTTDGGWTTIATPADLRAAPGTVGRPLAGVRVRIVAADGRVLPPGVPGGVGEVQVRGWRPDGGWARTGDLGRLDATGRLFLAGRVDDMIVSGGENVYPGPLLAALRSHPAVDDALLAAVPDEEFGQRWQATVCPLPGARLTEGELRDWLRGRVTRAETPRDVHVVAVLPRGSTGKPRRADPPA